jgi:phytoene dehydrogenase-like protein
LVRAGRAVGVRLANGEPVSADIVVSDADATHLYRDLVPRGEALRVLRRLRRTTPSLSGFVMLLALRGRTPRLQHHNVWFPDDYDAEFDAIFGREPRPVEDPAIYVCSPDDPQMRPEGHESWFVLVNAPRHEPATGFDWSVAGTAEQYADHVLAVLARRGVDVRDRVLWRELRTPHDIERGTRSPGGSIYGTSSNGRRAAFLRPANRSPVTGLFLVGGSAHPGGGLPLVGMSAQIVAGLVGAADG